jgi:thioredoxin 1
MLGPVVDEVAGDFAGKVKVVKVDVDSNQALAETFVIRGIPTILFFNKGELAERMVGVQPKDQIAKTLNALLGA